MTSKVGTTPKLTISFCSPLLNSALYNNSSRLLSQNYAAYGDGENLDYVNVCI